MSSCDARVKLLCLTAYFIAALHARSALSLSACALAAFATAASVRLDARATIVALRPFAVVLVITAIMQVLYIQQGPTLVQVGSVSITQGAIVEAVRMVAGLVCVTVVSIAFMRCTGTEQLVFALQWVLSPLRHLGIRIDAFMLSLSVAFRFVFVLVEEFGQLKRAQESRLGTFSGGVRNRMVAYTRLFPPLVRSSFRRADRLAEGLLSRCFGGEVKRTALHEPRLGPHDVALAVATCAVVIISFALGMTG